MTKRRENRVPPAASPEAHVVTIVKSLLGQAHEPGDKASDDQLAALVDEAIGQSALSNRTHEELPKRLLDAIRDTGLALDQPAYEAAFPRVVELLDELEKRLDEARYLSGEPRPGSADVWAFAVLVRFDPVYYGLYKCNWRRVSDSEVLSGFLADMAQWNELAKTVDFDFIKAAEYGADEILNPRLIVPLGGIPDLDLPHDRAWRFDANALLAAGTEEDGTKKVAGEWVRPKSVHRQWITPDGRSGYAPASGRYHLYLANNCPWCHRVALTRGILGLEDVISLDTVYFRRDADRGWQFRPDLEGFSADSIGGFRYVKELYERLDSTEGSLPILYDRETDTIVSNESAEIIRMLNLSFQELATRPQDLVPTHLEEAINLHNAWIYREINNGAYKAGFARSQEAYEQAYHIFFRALAKLDRIFATHQWLCGDTLTEADVRLYPTLFRFDPVYYTRFRLNESMVRDHPNLQRWLDDFGAIAGVAESSFIDHAKNGYFGRTGNSLVPLGPRSASALKAD